MTNIIDLRRLWAGNAPHESGNNVVSVILRPPHDKARLCAVLKSIMTQRAIREVIIVHDKRLPEITSLLATLSEEPKILVVDSPQMLVDAAAYNLGARYSSAPFLLFLKEGIVLESNAIVNLMNIGLTKSSPWLVGGDYSDQERQHLEKASCDGRQALLAWLKIQSNANQNIKPKTGMGIYSHFLSENALFMSSKAFWELKCFDERCQSTFHFDLCLRIHLAGGNVYLCEEPIFKPQLDQKMAVKGWPYFYRKHLSNKTNIIIVGLLLILAWGHQMGHGLLDFCWSCGRFLDRIAGSMVTLLVPSQRNIANPARPGREQR